MTRALVFLLINSIKNGGITVTKPYIVPVFLLEKSSISSELIDIAEKINSTAIEITESDIPLASRYHIKKFIEHRTSIQEKKDLKDFYLIPVGIDYEGNVSLSLFNSSKLIGKFSDGSNKTSLDPNILGMYLRLVNEIKESIDFIYIPREIDPILFTKLETKEIQVLMGKTLNETLSELVPQKQITDINRELNKFINSLAVELDVYSYRTPTDRQQMVKKNEVYNLLIQSFFSTRRLHKKFGDNWLEISMLSSGEKQKAIIDVAYGFLKNHRDSGSNLIIAIDEPESSLHMSACFEQFNAIYTISRACMQVLFTSHWYGFLPTLDSGSATIIGVKDDKSHVFEQLNLASYREQIKQLRANTKGLLPHDIRLKSINDFVQSVITSAMGDDPFNWIICEGSSEKIYLSAYLSDYIENRKLRIVPVGGAKEIKRLYNHIAVMYEEFQSEITGKIILLSDTDKELVSYEVGDFKNLYCRRMVNGSNGVTRLVKIQANPVSPATEIEDSLNGKVFFNTLKNDFMVEHSDLLGFLKDIVEAPTQLSSRYALDLRQSEWDKIELFFNRKNLKFKFAKAYVNNMNSESFESPSWIKEILKWLG